MELSKQVIYENILSELKNYLDAEGRLKLFPAKRRNKILALLYLSTKFEPGVYYKEKEVNEILERNHTFGDKWLLRRELIAKGFLSRLVDGSKYWMTEEQPTFEELVK